MPITTTREKPDDAVDGATTLVVVVVDGDVLELDGEVVGALDLWAVVLHRDVVVVVAVKDGVVLEAVCVVVIVDEVEGVC